MPPRRSASKHTPPKPGMRSTYGRDYCSNERLDRRVAVTNDRRGMDECRQVDEYARNRAYNRGDRVTALLHSRMTTTDDDDDEDDEEDEVEHVVVYDRSVGGESHMTTSESSVTSETSEWAPPVVKVNRATNTDVVRLSSKHSQTHDLMATAEADIPNAKTDRAPSEWRRGYVFKRHDGEPGFKPPFYSTVSTSMHSTSMHDMQAAMQPSHARHTSTDQHRRRRPPSGTRCRSSTREAANVLKTKTTTYMPRVAQWDSRDRE